MAKAKLHAGRVPAFRAGALILGIVSTLACARLTTLSAPGPGIEAYRAAVGAVNHGDYEQALSDFTSALEAAPHFSEAYFARGELFYLMGEYARAIADYSSALEADYQPAGQAHSARADAYMAAGDFDASDQDYGEAYALEGEAVSSYLPDRLEDFSRAVELHPELASAHYARAYANASSGNNEQAVADYSAAIELGHKPLGPVYFWRGWTFYWMEDYRQAVKDFSDAIELDPGSAEAYDGRAHAYFRLAEFEHGLDDLSAAVEIDPDFARGHNNLCWFGSLLGQVTEVMASCDRAVALEPDIPAYRDSRGLARALSGDYAGAIEDFQGYLAAVSSMGLEDEKRELWVAELEAGRNPFDGPTLQALLDE